MKQTTKNLKHPPNFFAKSSFKKMQYFLTPLMSVSGSADHDIDHV